MKAPFTKQARTRLTHSDYQQLRLKILERDVWRCQSCGKREQLEVHHIIHRSQSGADAEGNLTVLCGDCHQRGHSRA